MRHAVNSRSDGHPEALDTGLLKVAGVCVLASVMATLDTTVVSVAQRTFIAQFHTTHALVAWTMTGNTLALATVIPLTGWAADRFGARRLFMGSVLAFSLGSLLCAMAHDITLLIAFRVLQGLGGGMLIPLVFTILIREAGPNRLGRLMAALGIPMLLGRMGGPILSGWLIDSFGWEWIFLINVPIGVLAFTLAAVILEKDTPRSAPAAFDFVGVLLLSPGLALFLYGGSSLPAHGAVTSRAVWIPASVGLLLIIGFVFHALFRARHPLIDLRLFKNRVVALANVTMMLLGISSSGAVLLFPSYFQQLLGQTPLQSGVHLTPRDLGAVLTMPIAGWIVDKHGPRWVVLAGITLIVTGMGAFAYGVSHRYAYTPLLLTGLAVMGMGMGSTMMPLFGSAVRGLALHQVASGSTLINVNLQTAGSIGTALMSVILTSQLKHSQFIQAADKAAALKVEATKSGVPLRPSQLPPQVLQPGFVDQVTNDLSHAYTVVFVVAVALALTALISAGFLPAKPAAAPPYQPAIPALAQS
jgi:EmrB/QacA subfamily drug resistance transporter